MYQLSMSDDLNSRPDLYPWLINVYVDEKFRGRNVARELMNTVKENMLKWRNGEWNNLLDVVREGGDVSTNEYQTATRHRAWMSYH